MTDTTLAGPPHIATILDLHAFLQEAIAVEFSTIPVYLCGWWTINGPDPTNVAGLISDIVVAEMRHMTVVANILTATGGLPEITKAVRSVTFPAFLPGGETEFAVNLLPFGTEFLQQAMKIEQPTPRLVVSPVFGSVGPFAAGNRPRRAHRVLGMGDPTAPTPAIPVHRTIGEFYERIIAGIKTLVVQLGEQGLFPNNGNVSHQVMTFSNTPINSSVEALTLLTDIVEEGEGTSGNMWDENQHLSHFYTFQEIFLGKMYKSTDLPGTPTGDPITLPSAKNMHQNPKMSDYQFTPVWNDADAFNQAFAQIVADLDAGFKGQPTLVGDAVGLMPGLTMTARKVLTHSLPGLARVPTAAGPTFELLPYHLHPIPGL